MSRESKNLHFARRFARQFKSEDDANLLIETIRKEIPNVRKADCKFMLGVTRLCLDKEITTGNDIGNMNEIIKFITSDAHVNEYDYNLNGEHLKDLFKRFMGSINEEIRSDFEKLSKMQFTKNDEYDIIEVPDYETASKYSKYTSWCITHYSNMYDSYTTEGMGTFYFLLKKGFENVKAVHNSDNPLDEYGLSMIAVSVNANGSLNTCTCRWNHDNGGGDGMMNTEEISRLIGMNFYNVFHAPKLPEEIMNIRVLLSDRKTIVKVSDFDSLTMKAAGVEVTNGKFVSLKHTRDDDNSKAINWYKSNERIDKNNGEYLPTYEELKEWYDKRKLINGALIKVGGEPMDNIRFYWSSDERTPGSAWGLVSSGGGRTWGCESYCSCDDVRCRAFVRPLTLPCLFLPSAICR